MKLEEMLLRQDNEGAGRPPRFFGRGGQKFAVSLLVAIDATGKSCAGRPQIAQFGAIQLVKGDPTRYRPGAQGGP